MARIDVLSRVTVEATLLIGEAELRALDALVGYGTDAFLKAFYEKLGREYLEPHEEGIRSLFANFRAASKRAIRDVEEARRLLSARPCSTGGGGAGT